MATKRRKMKEHVPTTSSQVGKIVFIEQWIEYSISPLLEISIYCFFSVTDQSFIFTVGVDPQFWSLTLAFYPMGVTCTYVFI